MCGAFADTIFKKKTMHYYKVSMKNFWRAPMALVGFLEKFKESSDQDLLKQIAREYWEPTLSWKFFEYLGRSITIIEKVPTPNSIDISAGIFIYTCDTRLAKASWPKNKCQVSTSDIPN